MKALIASEMAKEFYNNTTNDDNSNGGSKYNNNSSNPVKLTTTLWFVIFLSIVIGLTQKLESRLFASSGNSKSHFSESFYSGNILISTDPQDIEILFYSRRNPGKGGRLLLNDTNVAKKSFFDPAKKTKILIHGFSAGMYFAHRFINEYLKSGDYNIIAIDWSKLAQWDNYPQAASNAILVGESVGYFLSRLIRETGLHPRDIHLVGHSLGSHVSAHIGRTIQRSGLGNVGRITALDPAKPWFDGSNRPHRISKHDADFVDVIHTNGGEVYEGCYSWTEPLGHVDFYPNGGAHQPGCTEVCLLNGCSQMSLLDIAGCSHDRAISFFIASIRSSRRLMTAKKCHSWDEFKSGKCVQMPEGVMGEHADQNLPEGSYYLEVNQHSPAVPQLLEVSI